MPFNQSINQLQDKYMTTLQTYVQDSSYNNDYATTLRTRGCRGCRLLKAASEFSTASATSYSAPTGTNPDSEMLYRLLGVSSGTKCRTSGRNSTLL